MNYTPVFNQGMNDVSHMVEYVTVIIADQLFGIPINQVEDVFVTQSITKVPLSDNAIAGVLNLRGRIVTALNMRHCFQFADKPLEGNVMAIGIEHDGESFGLIIDDVGEVLKLDENHLQNNPSNMAQAWARVARGIYQLEDQLLVILNVKKLLDITSQKQQVA